MRRLVWAVATACGFAAAWPALAQYDAGTLTEAQRRRIHLPYVRVATDCVARDVLASADAMRLGRSGRWIDAFNVLPKNSCASELGTLILTHDQLYGAGTGRTFVAGPYLADLPRAVGNRLRPEFDRMAAAEAQAEAVRRQEIARQETEKKLRIEQADRAFVLLREKMYECTNAQLANLITSAETAEVLATAAMTVCSADVNRAVVAMEAKVQLEAPGATTSAFRSELEATVRRQVVTTAVQVKAALNTPRAPVATPPGPAAAPPVVPAAASPPSAAQSPAVGTSSSASPVGTCLRSIAKVREGQFVDRDGLIKVMLDLCRPEIETSARTAFLKDDKASLDKLREQALADALREARVIVGVVN